MDRPPSRGLAVTGGAPPSRSGAAPGTAGRVGTSGSPRATATALAASSDPRDALTGQLIKRMRLKFGEAAADLKSQELIAHEVLEFMKTSARTGRLKESDIMALQERIRGRLVGDDIPKNTLTTEKRAQMDGDDWSKIFEYHIANGLAKDQAEKEVHRQQQEALRRVLARQVEEREERQRREHEEEVRYFKQEQEAIKRAEQEAEAKRKQKVDGMLRLKDDRIAQVQERSALRASVIAERRAEEQFSAARTAYETRMEFEKEEEARLQAKVALKEFLLANESNKALKEEAKRQTWEQDAAFKAEWEKILDKQERERTDRLERLKKIQNQQAEVAKGRPEAKRWLDPAIIDKQYKEKEEARAAEEVRRVAKVKSEAVRITSDLDAQLKEREARKEAARKQEQEHAARLAAKVKADEEREKARRAALQANKLKFRADIEAQMKDNAHRRRVAPMSETEKRINTELLGKVQAFQATGTVN